MNDFNQKNKHKIFYSIGEVAEMFDVNQSLIRYWEKNFDVLRPAKNKKGNRLFTIKDIDILKQIYHLVKERGMKLESAAMYMKNSGSNVSSDVEIVEKLQEIKSLLTDVLNEIEFQENDALHKNIVYDSK